MDANNQVTKMRKLDHVEQVDDKYEMLVELTNTGVYLDNLNDYCLLDIFSMEPLDLMDLCSIAESSKRFKEIVRRVIPKELVLVSPDDVFYSIKMGKHAFGAHNPDKVFQSKIKRIFKNFGSVLSEVVTESTGGSPCNYTVEFLLLELVATHCVDSLKTLKIIYPESDKFMIIPPALAVKLKPIFEQLQILSLINIFVDGDSTQFADCNSLMDLELMYLRHDCGAILKNVFPKLQKFRYINLMDTDVPANLETFILRNKSLKVVTLDMHDCKDTNKITIPEAMATGCSNLDELHINLNSISTLPNVYLQPLQMLKSLRVLSVSDVKFENFQLFAPMTELRKLSLRNCDLINVSSYQFSLLTHLTHLKVSGYDKHGVIDIIRRLTNLERIEIYWGHEYYGVYDTDDTFVRYEYESRFKLDERTFERIGRIVEGRPNVLELVCEFNFNASNDQHRMFKLIKLDDS